MASVTPTSSAAAETPTPAPLFPEPERHFANGFDITTSLDEEIAKHNPEKAASVARLIGRAGDRFDCRRITHASFPEANACGFGSGIIPTPQPQTVCPSPRPSQTLTSSPHPNPLGTPWKSPTPVLTPSPTDPAVPCTEENERISAGAEEMARAAVEAVALALEGLPAERDDIGTDLWGYFAAQAEIFAATPKADHYILAWTDGEDNVGTSKPFDLHGAKVVFILSEDDPMQYQQTMATVCATLNGSNASEVLLVYGGLSAEDIARVATEHVEGVTSC